jgi:hypothetical protein
MVKLGNIFWRRRYKMLILINDKCNYPMKTLIASGLLVFLLASNSYGQGDGKWSVGVNATPIFDGLTSSIFINRHIGERWQIGAMPFTRFYKYVDDFSKTTSTMAGLNFNARFYLTKWTFLKPYTYGYTGYGETYSKFEHSNGPTFNNVIKFFNSSIGVGMQVPIGIRGWSLDGNFGYQGYFANSEKSNFYILSSD